jgi:hypothetical protein
MALENTIPKTNDETDAEGALVIDDTSLFQSDSRELIPPSDSRGVAPAEAVAKKVAPPDLEVTLIGSVDADYETDPNSTIEVPSGVRMRAQFRRGGSVVLAGLPGAIRSGEDWILVRKDGVIELDARVTLAFAPDGGKAVDPPYSLIDLTMRGIADLVGPFGDDGTAAFRGFKRGRATTLDVAGSIRFEVADREQAGLDPTWIPHQVFDNEVFANLVQLVRQQFLLTAEIDVADDRYSPTRKIRMKIWSVGPARRVM